MSNQKEMGKCGNIHLGIFQQLIPWRYIIYNRKRNIDIDYFSEAWFLDHVKIYKFFKPHLHMHTCTFTHICVYEKEVVIKLSSCSRRLMEGKGQENLHCLRKCVVMGGQDIFIIQHICDSIYVKTHKKNFLKKLKSPPIRRYWVCKNWKRLHWLTGFFKNMHSINTSSWHTITLM